MAAPARAKPKARATAPAVIPMLIGGEWRAAAETAEVRAPYRGEVVSHAPRSSLADLDAALSAALGYWLAARAAARSSIQPSWSMSIRP